MHVVPLHFDHFEFTASSGIQFVELATSYPPMLLVTSTPLAVIQ